MSYLDTINKIKGSGDGPQFDKHFTELPENYNDRIKLLHNFIEFLLSYTIDELEIEQILMTSRTGGIVWEEPNGKIKTKLQKRVTERVKRAKELLGRRKDLEPQEKVDPAIEAEAMALLRDGEALDYMTETFHLEHPGDPLAFILMALVTISSVVLQSSGLHLFINAERGSGKSHAASTFAKQIPAKWAVVQSVSSKFFYYGAQPSKDNKPAKIVKGGVLFTDDRGLSQEIMDLAKEYTSSWQTGISYGTIVDREWVNLDAPPRFSFVISKVALESDDQALDRFLMCAIDTSPEQQQLIEKAIKGRYCEGLRRPDSDLEHRIAVCREMWNALKLSYISVDVPFANALRFNGLDARNKERFMNLLVAYSAFSYFARPPRTNSQGIPLITATMEECNKVILLYSKLFEGGAQGHKLIQRETELVVLLLKINQGEFTIQDILGAARRYGVEMNDSKVRRALHGDRVPGGKEYHGGLLNKCAHVRFEGSECITTGFDVERQTRRKSIYSVDIPALRAWYHTGDPVSIDPSYAWEDTPGEVAPQMATPSP